MRQRQTGRVLTAEASCATGSQSQACSSLRPVHRTHRQLKRYRRAPLHIGAHCGSVNSSDGFPEVAPDAEGMAAGRSASYRARRLEAERRRREQSARREATSRSAGSDAAAPKPSDGGARRAAAVSCSWCGGAVTPRSRGPIPKWCSTSCRRRAWEQTRAAASGRSAVQVVERRVEVPASVTPTRGDWVPLLTELARQMDDGRVYDRELAALTAALRAVLAAHSRRPWVRDRRSGGSARLW